MPGTDLLISWTIVGSGPLATQLRRGKLASELLGVLQNEFGAGSPVAWSASMEMEPAVELPAEWFEQNTICGDFLRELRQEQLAPERPLVLTDYLPKELAKKEASEAGAEDDRAPETGLPEQTAEISDASVRETVLREAAMLGVDLLSGEETVP